MRASRGLYLGQTLSPGICQVEAVRPLIRRVRATLDQAFGFHRLKRHTDVSLGHQQALRQFLLADSLAIIETEENLKTREVQVVLPRHAGCARP